MGDIAGPLIVLMLGLAVGILFHLPGRRFWVASALAAVVGASLWVGGCYLLFAFTAPNELGPPLLASILLTLATALAGSIAAGGAVHALHAR